MTQEQQLLKKYFGYETFRGLQHQIIHHVIGNKDCLVLMPTGGGKSICYQIPALMKEGITLVVSPLISLMKDQVDALVANGIQAAFLNSSLSYAQEQEVAARCLHGQIKLLYMSPEKTLSMLDGFLSQVPVSLIAIDEAHCVSQWGHDFRPEYKDLYKLREKFAQTPIMALTATADKITRQDILSLLGLREPQLFVASFDRPNISLAVKQGLKKKDKLKDIARFLEKHPNQCGIIYCTARNTVDALAIELRNMGIKAGAYHAGMDSQQRNSVQEKFINDDLQVVCATIAFGMGIDKSNVRFVMHYNLPKSIENYYQEIGRGGRDGLPCDTVLYYSLGDVMMLRDFASGSGQPEINLEKLKRMQEFAEARHCRRRILLNYFGQQHTENCGNCDICLHPPATFNGTVLAQKALSALSRIHLAGEQAGVYLLIDVLRGMRHKEIYERNLDKIKTYGAGADLSSKTWQQYLMQMIQLGVMEIAYHEGNVLRVTPFGELILRGKFELPLHQVENDFEPARKATHAASQRGVNEHKDEIFEALRKLRKQVADDLHMPPYIIFNDSSLVQMSTDVPHTMAEMMQVSGVSHSKMEKYGYRFLEITKQFPKPEKEKAPEINKVLSEENLVEYMNELKTKGLRFTSATVAYVLIGSDRKSYASIVPKVSFGGILQEYMTYEQVSKRIKPFYEPYEREHKEAQRMGRPGEQERLERRAKAELYFQQEVFNKLGTDGEQKLRSAVKAIPFQKPDETVSEAVRELRKQNPRAHEPWGNVEEILLEQAVKQCNDLNLLVNIFGRSPNSIVAMSSKWAEALVNPA
ncbi:MAG: DNA helicase RecQ [Bacteroidia bacterium]|nr:DNA helicase RecQ [Bacteroidia bacterium]